MIGDLRKSFDAIAQCCDIEDRRLRTKVIRHTYCSARLQTVERKFKPGFGPNDRDAFDWADDEAPGYRFILVVNWLEELREHLGASN
jgi:hypothetical protein